MFYRIALTIAVVLVCVFAASRIGDRPTATPAQQSVPSDEAGMKGLQIN